MYSKAKIFNLSLGLLLLTRDIKNPETDKSNECKVLNTHWDAAFSSALEDMDLDATSSEINLTLITRDPNTNWAFAYRYPDKCAFFRRIQSTVDRDNRSTHVLRKVRIYNGVKAIFTNEAEAIAEYIPTDLHISILSPNAGLCVAARLAELSSALIVGKGAKDLRNEIVAKYAMFKAQAQAHDKKENFNFEGFEEESEFVQTRLE